MTRRTGPALAVVATTAEVLTRPDLGEELLLPWERRRLDRVRVPGRRDDVLAARLLLRLCAARWTGRPVHELEPAQFCAVCGRYGHGRPYLRGHPGTGVSLSHADGLVAAAVGAGPVGVDVEPAGRRPAALPGHGPGPGRARLLQWVRREALFKAGAIASPYRPGADGTLPVGGPGGAPAGRYVLDWTDERRAAVAAAAAAVPVRLLTTADLPPETPPPPRHLCRP
ncbi:4'-phosphopantetheinyl transferase family protein [Streptomyces termitum]